MVSFTTSVAQPRIRKKAGDPGSCEAASRGALAARLAGRGPALRGRRRRRRIIRRKGEGNWL